MENLLISMFCGLIIAVDLLAARFGWDFAQRLCSVGWATELLLAAIMYRLAVVMACDLTEYLGATNNTLVEALLFVPILISVTVAAICQTVKSGKTNKMTEDLD